MGTKHIKTYSNFLLEQDMMGGMPGAPGGAAPAPKVERYKFIFLVNVDDASVPSRKYPDGSIIAKYPCYSITLPELEKWASSNIISTDKLELNPSEIELKRKNITQIVKGDKTNVTKDDKSFVEKLKNAVASNIIGKKEVDVEVVYANDKVPTTEQIDVTFIKLPEK
jgi:hypothetical protein